MIVADDKQLRLQTLYSHVRRVPPEYSSYERIF